MALPLGKLSLLVGAGIVGSILAKEGRVPNVSDFFSGAFKIAWKQIRPDNSTPSSAKPRNDSLLAQVNSLRQELQLLASNRSVTIVTSTGSGTSKYGVIIIVVVIGSGYVWWKGWKLPDMMFATRRSLSDACSNVAKQLETVYTSISATKRHLSSRIDRVDCSLDECGELNTATREEVSELRGETKVISVDVQSVHHAVRTLETKISRIEVKQDQTTEGVFRLVDYAWNMEKNKTADRLQAAPTSSSGSALELPQITSSSRTGSLPPVALLEPPTPPASSGSRKVQRLQPAISASGFKELHGISGVIEDSRSPGEVSSGGGPQQVPEDTTNNGLAAGSGLFGRKLSFGGALLTRTRSAMQSFKQQT